MADADSSHVKIMFDLEQDEDGYPPYAAENLWAIQRADGYEVDNIPWYAKGIACGDLVAAKPDGDGRLTFERVRRCRRKVPTIAPSYRGCGRNV